MSPPVAYAKQRLLFFVGDDVDDEIAQDLERLVADLAARRVWSTGPPVYVDEVDDSSMSSPEDLPIRTVGGILELYSNWSREGARLPKHVDLATLEEVKTLVEVLTGFSNRTGHEIAFELEDEPIGSIRQGTPDRMLSEGFIGEWERDLNTRT